MKFSLIVVLFLAVVFSVPHFSFADEDDLEKEESASEQVRNSPKWTGILKEEYHLSDEQIVKMKDSGIANPQMAMIARLAEKSGKTIDEVLKMRIEGKMGWGQIAKELGVSPKEIGQAVANTRHRITDIKRENKREARHKERELKREARMMKRESKRQNGSHGMGH